MSKSPVTCSVPVLLYPLPEPVDDFTEYSTIMLSTSTAPNVTTELLPVAAPGIFVDIASNKEFAEPVSNTA